MSQPTQPVQVPFLSDDLLAAIAAAYEHQSYVNAAGTKSSAKLADDLADLARKHEASKDERVAKACRYEKAIGILFDNVAGPDDWGNEPNPLLAQAIYKAIREDFRTLLRPDLTGAVQQRVIKHGVILCRTTLGGGRSPDAFYVTKDKKAINEDFAPLYRDKAYNTGERYGANMAMVATVFPEFADWALNEFNAGMKAALQAGGNALAPALAAAKTDKDKSGNGGGK